MEQSASLSDVILLTVYRSWWAMIFGLALGVMCLVGVNVCHWMLSLNITTEMVVFGYVCVGVCPPATDSI